MILFRKCDLQAQFTTNYKLPLTSYNELEQLRTIYTNVEQVRLNQNNNYYVAAAQSCNTLWYFWPDPVPPLESAI